LKQSLPPICEQLNVLALSFRTATKYPPDKVTPVAGNGGGGAASNIIWFGLSFFLMIVKVEVLLNDKYIIQEENTKTTSIIARKTFLPCCRILVLEVISGSKLP
jgi:hypothetical protein